MVFKLCFLAAGVCAVLDLYIHTYSQQVKYDDDDQEDLKVEELLRFHMFCNKIY